MKKELREKWQKLYDYAISITRMKPWSWMSEDKLIIIKAYEGLEFYLSVMGKHGMFEGIMMCTSKKTICNYSEMQANMIPDLYGINYQEGILFVFNKEKVCLDENIKIASEFMPRKINNKIITFESFVKGYFPSQLTEEELDDELLAMECFEKTLKSFKLAKKKENKKQIELENLQQEFINDLGKCLILSYDEENDILNIDIDEEPDITDFSAVFEIPNEVKEYLKDAKKRRATYEIEFLNYLPIPTKKINYKTPIMNESINKVGLLRYFIINDISKNEILKFEMSEDAIMSNKDEHDYVLKILDKIIEIFKLKGIPREIYVRDEETSFALDDLVKALNIKITVLPNLLMADNILYGLVENVTGKSIDDYEDDDDDDDEDEDD